HDGPQIVSIISTNGGNPLLTLSNVFNSPLSWSPDSSRIAYNKIGNVYTAKADGTDQRLLISNRRLSSFHSWGGLAKAATAQGTNVTARSGGTSVTFSNVTTPGETAVIPLPALGPTLPQGYFNIFGISAFDVVSSAGFGGPITITFPVS